MKIFEDDCKINFVDKNNVLLGYSNTQKCCEKFGWFIADEPMEKPKPPFNKEIDGLEEYVFDQKYFKEITDQNEYQEGAMVIFRITNGKDKKYIHLFNVHNGCYTHNFEFTANNKKIMDCYL